MAIRHTGLIYPHENNTWGNHNSTMPPITVFSDKYIQDPKALVTAMDVAVWLKDPVFVGMLKAKVPKLNATYNTGTIWYAAFMNDLEAFKKYIKAGTVPSSYDVAYMIHYGKKDFLAFIDVAAVFKTKEEEKYVSDFSFSLVDDAPLISTVADYLDKNVEIASTDAVAFSNGLYALPVDWQKIRMWRGEDLFSNESDDNWDFEKLVTGFSHNTELTKAFKIAFYRPTMDGYYESSGSEYLWFNISSNGTQFEARFLKKPEDNKSGAVTIVDVDLKTGKLLCDFAGFGKYWVNHGNGVGIDLASSLNSNDSDRIRIGFNRKTKTDWDIGKLNLIILGTTVRASSIKPTGDLVIPGNITTIEAGAFKDCTGLTSVIIPSSVTSIGQSAFEGCTGLIDIIIPNSVSSIGTYAFHGCIGLTSVTIPSTVASIEANEFSGCTGLVSVIIPNGVSSIGYNAFQGCTGLTSVSIPGMVTTIEQQAFMECTGLTSVIIPNGVTLIELYLFRGCTSLTSITIPSTVTSISTAFEGCDNLAVITCNPTIPPKLDYNAFGYRPTLQIKVPADSVASYQEHSSWRNYKNQIVSQ